MIMAMFLQVEMKPGVGPVFDKPLVLPADLESLTTPDVKVCLNLGHLDRTSGMSVTHCFVRWLSSMYMMPSHSLATSSKERYCASSPGLLHLCSLCSHLFLSYPLSPSSFFLDGTV